jgi:hypothetical protein
MRAGASLSPDEGCGLINGWIADILEEKGKKDFDTTPQNQSLIPGAARHPQSCSSASVSSPPVFIRDCRRSLPGARK